MVSLKGSSAPREARVGPEHRGLTHDDDGLDGDDDDDRLDDDDDLLDDLHDDERAGSGGEDGGMPGLAHDDDDDDDDDDHGLHAHVHVRRRIPRRGPDAAGQLGAAPRAPAHHRVIEHDSAEIGAARQPGAASRVRAHHRVIEHDSTEQPAPAGAGFAGKGAAAQQRERRALHLFSGKKDRADGLKAQLIARGWSAVDEIDAGVESHAGAANPAEDLLDDDFSFKTLPAAEGGKWRAGVEGIPCTTFTVARFKPNGVPVVRCRPDETRGLREPPVGHEHEAERANELVRRACAIAAAVQASGGVYIIENPIDRGDRELSQRLRLGFWPAHAPLWLLDEIIELQLATGGQMVHFPQCAVGGGAQKWTTFLYSPALAALGKLGDLRCSHKRSEHIAASTGRVAGGWASAALAAYPRELNEIIADALDAAVPLTGGAASSAEAVSSEAAPTTTSAAAAPRLFEKLEACVLVPAGSEDSTEGRPCTVIAVHMDDIDPYYTVQLEDGSVRETIADRLRSVPVVGSKRPHAHVAEAEVARPAPRAAASMSLRNNEPELLAVLEAEAFPQVNVPPTTEWFDVARDANVPEPLSTDELIPEAAQRAAAAHIRAVQQCYKRASRGEHGWQAARVARPQPLELSEAESLHPAGRGWSWVRREGGLWHPLTRSRWPDDPPETDLDVAAVLAAAKADAARFGSADADFPDQFVLACMAHGYPAPELERATVLGYPHVGALKSMEGLHKCLAKDRKSDGVEGAQAWTVHGGAMPQVWPMRADPINVVWRNGKPRITIDKTMQLSDVYESYNAAVALEKYDPVEMVRVQQLCRAIAILMTAGVGVRVWSFDLEAYFRKTGKQRADWWKSGYVLPDDHRKL